MGRGRALLVIMFGLGLIVLLLRLPDPARGQLAPDADLPAVMKHFGLRSGVIAYGTPGSAPEFHLVKANRSLKLHYWSLSKPMTAAAVLSGVEKGLISLDEKVAGASVADILRHAGGWDREIAGDPVHERDGPARCIDMAPPPQQFEPGTRSTYSNLGYCLLGRLVEERFGKPYEDVVREVVPAARNMDYDAWLGPAGGWSGTAGQYFSFASQPVDPRALERPGYIPEGPYYAMGWRVLGDGTLSHYGIVIPTKEESYTVVYKRPDWIAVGLFQGQPNDFDAARTALLPALERLAERQMPR